MPYQSILGFLMTYRYAALLPLAILEGPLLALAVGFLASLGYFSFVGAYLVMIMGDFIPDSAYYAIGRFGNRARLIEKYDTKNKMISRHFDFLSRVWHGHPMKTMFVSKLAYGLSIPLLITAGLSRVPYKRFIWQALIVTLFQYGTLMCVGYALGNSYQSAVTYVKYIEVIIAALAIALITAYFLIQRYFRNRVVEREEHNDETL